MKMMFSRRMAVLGCLAVVLGWSHAAAQFVRDPDNGGYRVTHTVAAGTSQWQQLGARGASWDVASTSGGINDGRVGVRPGTDRNGDGFFILNPTTHTCSDDGTFEVEWGVGDFDWAFRTAAVVFRYTAANRFYALRIPFGHGTTYRAIRFSINTLYSADAVDANETVVGSDFMSSDHRFAIRVVMMDNTFRIYRRNTATGSFAFVGAVTDPDNVNPTGQVGYAQANNWQRGGIFFSSSWRDTNTTRELNQNWYAWNMTPGNNITAGSGSWGGQNWSAGLLSSSLINWPTTGTRHALFGGRDSTAGAYRIVAAAATVDSMMFESSGYVIDAGTGALTLRDRIVIPRGKTAQINATLAGTSGLNVSAAGTGTGQATLILGTGAANTVSGASSIGENTIVRAARATGALGTGAVTVTASNARLELAGGTLTNRVNIGNNHLFSLSGNNFVDSAVTLQGGAVQHTVTADAPLEIRGAIGPAGGAGLIKAGSSFLTLTGNNTYTGVTTVNSDTLFIGSGTSGSLAGSLNIAQGAAAVFNRSNAATQTGISGAGNLFKRGAGTLTLAGSNTSYTGAITITAGAIEIAAAAALGAATNTVTIGPNGRLILNPAAAMDFGRTITSAANTSTLEKTGTSTVNLTGASMTIGTVVVSGGTVNANYTGVGLLADSVRVNSGARLGGAAEVGRTGARIHVNGGTLFGSYYAGAVNVTGTGTIENRSLITTQISGSLTLASTARTDIQLTADMKTTAATPRPGFMVTGALALGGTLNITNTLIDSDTGTYRIMQAGGAITGNFSPTITVDGVDAAATGYEFAISATGGFVTLRITLPANPSIIRNPLQVTGATFISEGTTGSNVRLTLSGFDGLRPHLTGNPSVNGIFIYYKPDSRATSWSDTTSAGGRIQIHPSGSFTFPTGNTATIDISVPWTKGALDAIYYFNAGVTWLFNGTLFDPSPPLSAAASVFPLNPMRFVTANPLAIAVSGHSSDANGVTFNLTVSGQTNAALTPGVDHKPSVDSVAVWVKRGGDSPAFTSAAVNALAQASVSGASAFMGFTLAELRTNGTFTYETPTPVMTGIETFYFAIAPRWTGAGVDSLARPLFVASVPVTAYDRPTPNNPCYLEASQPDVRAPNVAIEVGVSEPFNELAVSVRVDFSFNPQMPENSIFRTVNLTRAQVETVAAFSITNDSLVGETRTVHYRITVFDSDNFGVERQGSFTVGRPRPLPPAGIMAEPNGGGTMRVRWNRVTPEINNIGDGPSQIWIAYSATRPAADVDVSTMPGAVSLPITATETILSGMAFETDYWFAVMVHDIVRSSAPAYWNLKSNAAIITANSGADNIVPNVVEITSAVFNEAATNFTVNYKLVQNADLGTTLRYYVLLGEDTVSRSAEPHNLRGFTAGHEDLLQTLSLGNALQFNTTYHIYLYSVNPEGLPALGRAVMEVEVGSFSNQLITIVRNGSAFADNGRLGFVADNWSTAVESVTCTLTINQSTLGENAHGIELLGEYGYEYTAAAGAFISVLDPLTIRIQADDDIRYSPRRNDVRIYRFKSNVWEVVYDTRYVDGYFVGTMLDMIYEDMGSTYRLGIISRPPTVRVGGATITGGAHPRRTISVGDVIPGSEETYSVESSVGNTRSFMLVAPANNPSASALRRVEPSTLPSASTSWAFEFRIDPQLIIDAADFGLFMFLVVTDGLNTDTINVSRRIRSPSVYPGFRITPEARRWLPFASQSELEETSAENALRQLFAPGDDFAAHDTLFRLVRWDPNYTDASLRDRWVEYGNVPDDAFTLTPGRLMWIKTASARTFNFGAATSHSLIDPFMITLPPGEWTDFVLPFTYDICLGDVLTATTGVENLHFYRWRQSGTTYITEQAAVVRVDSSYVLRGGDDPFTIFNNGTTPVTLRVPPRPAFMSRHRSSGQSKQPMTAIAHSGSDLWYYSIRPRTQSTPELNEVMVGYAPSERTFPVPPTFSNESVVLVGEDGRLMGHHLSPAVAKGGKTFRLRFYNDERQRTTFRFTAVPDHAVPGDARVMFLNAVTGNLIEPRDGEYSLTVAGNSYEDIYMVVGSREYQAKITTPATTKFTVAGISVNQAARSMRLRYYIPSVGIDRVEVSIYDIKGRMAWRNMERVRPGAWNTMEWNTRGSRRGVGAGLYIVRVRAVDARGRTVAVENRRITFAR
jgi:autotransporter-associated beta strand protein